MKLSTRYFQRATSKSGAKIRHFSLSLKRIREKEQILPLFDKQKTLLFACPHRIISYFCSRKGGFYGLPAHDFHYKRMTFNSFRDGIQHFVYRLIDLPVRLLVKVGVTPNMITTLGLLGNILAAWLIVRSAMGVFMASSFGMPVSYALLGWAGLCIIAFSICDMVDGYMARTHHMESRFGAFYDSVLDRYQELFTLSAIAFFFMAQGDWGSALITALALIGSIMVSYVRARAEALGCDCKVGLMQRPERVVVLVLGLLLAGFLQHVVPFNSLWFLFGAVTLIAVLANWTAIVRILHVKKQL